MRFRALLPLLLFSSTTAHAQWATLDWQNCIGGNYAEGLGMCAFPGGGFVITGPGVADGDIVANSAEANFMVARVDANGGLLWARTYGGTGSEAGRGVCATANGDIWAVGYTTSSDGDVTGYHGGFDTPTDLWVMKLAADGDVLWQRACGGSDGDGGYGIAAMPDGGCVVTGITRSTDGDLVGAEGPVDTLGNDDIYVLRLAPNGDMLWQRRMGDDWVDDGQGVCIGDDSHIYVGGSHGEDAFVAKFTYEGDLVWENTYGGSYFDYGLAICAVDGGVAFCGVSGSQDGDVFSSGDDGDLWVARIDLDGELVWSYTAYQVFWVPLGPSVGYGITRTPDDGVAVAAFCDWQSDRNFAPWYVSPSGGMAFAGFYGGPGAEICYGIAVDEADGGIGVCGKTAGSDGGDVSGSNGLDAWVIELASTIGFEEVVPGQEALVWYGATEGSLCATGSMGMTSLRVLDAQGRIVFSAPMPPGGGRVQLPALPMGVYVAEVLGSERRLAARTLAIGAW